MRLTSPSHEIMFVQDPQEVLKQIELAGRTCYRSEDSITPESAKVFTRKILDSGHHSVIEHVSITVRFICDRGITHELVRHRLASYSQESTRYANYSTASRRNQQNDTVKSSLDNRSWPDCRHRGNRCLLHDNSAGNPSAHPPATRTCKQCRRGQSRYKKQNYDRR